MPKVVQREFGFALHLAQIGSRHICAKVLRGFGSAGVLEVVEDFATDTYRAVYTVRFADAVFTSCTASRRNQQRASKPQNQIWI